jgi:molecular chaperone GrpE
MNNIFVDISPKDSKETQNTYSNQTKDQTIEVPTSDQYYDENTVLDEAAKNYLEKTSKRIMELEKLAEDHTNQYNRLLADFANYKNRVAREIQFAINLSEKKLLLELLPVMDSFERCLAANYNTVEEFNSGAALINKQLIEAMRKIGVEEISLKVGDAFNPQHAEALTTTERLDLPDESVAVVFEKGFMFKDSLLRPAKVVINNHNLSN